MPRPRLRGWIAATAWLILVGGANAWADGSVSEAQLEMFLGLTPPMGLNSGDLSNLGNGPVTSGSAIMQTIMVSAGATLSFDYDFLTNAPPPSTNPLGAVDPFGFITNPTLMSVVDNFYDYPATMAAAPPQSGFMYQSGYQMFTETFAMGGTYSLGIGVANVTTDEYSSGLLVDNFSLTGGSLANGTFSSGDFTGWQTIGNTSIVTSAFGISPENGTYQALISTGVPEPSTIVLLAVGCLGAAAFIRRHGSRRATGSLGC